MAEVVSRFDVPVKGVGKPDYSREVALGQVRAGLTLKYNESLKFYARSCTAVASPASWFKPPLGIGATEHLVDMETGLEMPSSLPAGYIATIRQKNGFFTEDVRGWIYADGNLLALSPIFSGGSPLYWTEMIGFSSAFFDPTALTAHAWDFRVTNLGAAVAEGQEVLIVHLEPYGTEPLRGETKTVKCKFCGLEHVVPQETKEATCPNCGMVTLYYTLGKLKGL